MERTTAEALSFTADLMPGNRFRSKLSHDKNKRQNKHRLRVLEAFRGGQLISDITRSHTIRRKLVVQYLAESLAEVYIFNTLL